MASNIITRNPSYLNRQLTIDRNTALTATGTATGLQIDYDHTGISASGQTVTGIGLDLDMNCESVTHVGTVNQTGIDLDMVAATDGVQNNVCIDVKCSGGDEATGLTIDTDGGTKSTGIYIDNKNSTTDFKNVSSADPLDYFMINTIASGATTLSTVDNGAAVGHLTLDVDGDLILDPDSGNIYLKDSGTTFGLFGTTGAYSVLTLYEDGGASDDDYLNIRTTTHGATEIRTVDTAAQAAHMTFNADGNVVIGCYPGASITLQENDASEYTPQVNSDAATKKYVDDNVCGFMLQTTVTISEAEMNALHTTEKILVAAQGANLVIVPINLTAFVDRDASTTQANNVFLNIGVNGGTTVGTDVWSQIRRFMYNESGDRIINFSAQLPLEISDSLDAFENRHLTAKLSAAITSDSIDSVKLIVTYYVFDNS